MFRKGIYDLRWKHTAERKLFLPWPVFIRNRDDPEVEIRPTLIPCSWENPMRFWIPMMIVEPKRSSLWQLITVRVSDMFQNFTLNDLHKNLFNLLLNSVVNLFCKGSPPLPPLGLLLVCFSSNLESKSGDGGVDFPFHLCLKRAVQRRSDSVLCPALSPPHLYPLLRQISFQSFNVHRR